MQRVIQFVLLLSLAAPACAIDNLLIERRLATLEDQHVNQDNYNHQFDVRVNEKLDTNQRATMDQLAALERAQTLQAATIQNLRDTQNIALFLASLTPLALGWFYFKKASADRKRNDAILATENRLEALEGKPLTRSGR